MSKGTTLTLTQKLQDLLGGRKEKEKGKKRKAKAVSEIREKIDDLKDELMKQQCGSDCRIQL